MPAISSTVTEPAAPAVPEETKPPMTEFDNPIIADLNNAFIKIADKVQPSVVTIFSNKVVRQTQTTRNPHLEFFGDDFFRRFLGRMHLAASSACAARAQV